MLFNQKDCIGSVGFGSFLIASVMLANSTVYINGQSNVNVVSNYTAKGVSEKHNMNLTNGLNKKAFET